MIAVGSPPPGRSRHGRRIGGRMFLLDRGISLLVRHYRSFYRHVRPPEGPGAVVRFPRGGGLRHRRHIFAFIPGAPRTGRCGLREGFQVVPRGRVAPVGARPAFIIGLHFSMLLTAADRLRPLHGLPALQRRAVRQPDKGQNALRQPDPEKSPSLTRHENAPQPSLAGGLGFYAQSWRTAPSVRISVIRSGASMRHSQPPSRRNMALGSSARMGRHWGMGTPSLSGPLGSPERMKLVR